MKKLLTLLTAIIASFIWLQPVAAWTYNSWLYCNIDTQTRTKNQCGGGNLLLVSGSTTVNTANLTSNNVNSNSWLYFLTDYALSYGSSVTVTATAIDGYRFVEWQVSGGVITNYTISGNVLSYTIPSNPKNELIYAHAIFTADNGGGGDEPAEPAGPEAGDMVNYTASPGTNAMQCGPNVTIPNFANAIDLGFNVLWAKKNVGAAGVDYRGTRYTNAEAKALTAEQLGGAGWRLPAEDDFNSNGLLKLTEGKVGNNVVLTHPSAYNGVELEIATEGAATYLWCSKSDALNNYCGKARIYNGNGYWDYPESSTSASDQYWVRPVFDLAAAGIYKLTINVVKEGVTNTNNYYVANNQQVTITPAVVSGYNSDWTSGQSGTGAKTFTVTENTTATITYTEAISYVTATFNNYDGTQLAQYTNVVSGTTPTYSGATPTKPEDNYNTYEFSGWNTAADGSGNALGDITANTTYYAQFNTTPRTYSVTFLNSAEDQNPTVKNDYHYGDAITNRPVIDPQRIGDEEHNYTFVGWQLGETVYTNNQVDAMTVSGNMVFTASFDEEIIPILPNTSKITIGSFAANGKVLIISQGNTVELSSEGGYVRLNNGTSVSIQAVANDYYHFSGWAEDMDEEAIIDIRSLNGDVTYTPTFALNTALTLVDNEDEAYYTDLYNTHDGEVLTVTMQDRQLTEGTWITFCLPFDYTIPVGHPFSGAVYQLYDATMSGTNTSAYISMDFHRTYEMKANVPYLIVPTMTTATNLVFDGVTIDEAPQQKMVEAISGSMQFVSQPWQATITNTADKPNFYLASANKLRYVKTTGTTFKAFRAYFHRLIDLGAPVRRMVINLDGVETTKEISDEGEVVDITSKRMENGVLYIERNGVRYDAQGQRVE